MAARRRRGEDSISFDHRGPCTDPERHRNCPGRWRAEVSRGYDASGKRVKSKVTATSKTALLEKLKALHEDLDAGVEDRSATLRQAIDTWLEEGLDGRSAKTIKRNRSLFYAAENPGELRPEFASIGKTKLRELKATQVRLALVAAAETRSPATMSLIHNCLTRAIRHAEANDLVRRNVAALVETTPQGKRHGRPSKSLSLTQAVAVINASRTLPEIRLHPGLKDTRRPAEVMHAYVVLSLLAGVRTEESRALLWSHVVASVEDEWTPVSEAGWEHEKYAVYVWRSVRAQGETKTEKSRRTLALPRLAATTLAALWKLQSDEKRAAGDTWKDTGLVYTTALGTALDSSNVRHAFKRITKAAGIGEDWTPRELRHTFVSLISESGVPIDEIARLVGHAGVPRNRDCLPKGIAARHPDWCHCHG